MSGRSMKMLRRISGEPDFSLIEREVLANVRQGTRISPKNRFRRLKREYRDAPEAIKAEVRKQYRHIRRMKSAGFSVRRAPPADEFIRSFRIGSWKAMLYRTGVGLFRVEIPSAHASWTEATEKYAIESARRWNRTRKQKKITAPAVKVTEGRGGPKLGF